MSNVEIKFPKVNFGFKNKDEMTELITSEWSPFFDKDRADVFIFCMSYGFARGLTRQTVPGTGTMPPERFLEPERNLMRSLAIAETGDMEVIKNARAYVTICEEYAYAAFSEVYKICKENADARGDVHIPLYDMIDNIQNERV